MSDGVHRLGHWYIGEYYGVVKGASAGRGGLIDYICIANRTLQGRAEQGRAQSFKVEIYSLSTNSCRLVCARGVGNMYGLI